MQSRTLARLALLAFAVITACAAMAPAAFAAGVDPHAPLTVVAHGKAFTYATPSSLVTSESVVNTSAISAWVTTIAKSANRSATNASFKVNKKKRRIDFKKSKDGYKLNAASSVTAITNELLAEVGGAPARTIVLPGAAVKAHVRGFGRKVLVVLSRRKIYLYKNMKVEKTYRCAIGMAVYPTPQGTFYIGKKAKNPSWTNGGAAWAKGMPSYIAPGPSNPLGTRALYVYKNGSDTGVRFHGTNKVSSIGQAASHGCMRMTRKSVEDFYKRVPLKTEVYIIK